MLAIKITVRTGAGKSLTTPNIDLFCCICLSIHGNDKIGLSFFAKHLLFSMASASRRKEQIRVSLMMLFS